MTIGYNLETKDRLINKINVAGFILFVEMLQLIDPKNKDFDYQNI